jgi:hypothetical protein
MVEHVLLLKAGIERQELCEAYEENDHQDT